jgi:hypothetical protein
MATCLQVLDAAAVLDEAAVEAQAVRPVADLPGTAEL